MECFLCLEVEIHVYGMEILYTTLHLDWFGSIHIVFYSHMYVYSMYVVSLMTVKVSTGLLLMCG